jgi:hypothetical protein
VTDPHSTAPPPDEEPRTPLWLPALGAGLFIAVGVAWAIVSSKSREAAPEPPPPSTVMDGGNPSRAVP